MVSGQHLRTNYRRTGGVLDINALGGYMPWASIHGGSGMNPALPYGGFMMVSWHGSTMCGGTGSDLGDLCVDGLSGCWVQSAAGLMSAFYGSDQACALGGGYAFMPVGCYIMSLTGAALTDGGTFGSQQTIFAGRRGYGALLSASAMPSIAWIRIYKGSISGTISCASECAIGITVWGFIISGP